MEMISCYQCNEQVNSSFKFCPNCGTSLKNEIVCLKCNYANEANSKFCQECGSPLRKIENGKIVKEKSDKAIPVLLPNPQANGIVVEFRFTSSSSFDFALSEAQKISSFEKFGEDKKAVYRISIDEKDIFRLLPLVSHMRGWRNRIVYLNGDKVTWESVFSFTWCYERKLSSFSPSHYCFGSDNEWEFNIWGCIQARMGFNSNAEWFTFGKWLNNNGDWQYDKERIKHELTSNLFEYRFCPALDAGFVQDVLRELPNVVNPTKNVEWKFIESYQEANNSLVVTKNTYGVEQKIYYKGVGPNGNAFIKRLSEKIKNRIPMK